MTIMTMKKNRKAYDKIIKARTALVLNHPFFASLALRLKVREDTSCATAWTDGNVFAYNPAYIIALSPEKAQGLCAHTVMHPALGHHKRRKNRDHDIWNRACDYSINPILLDAGITLPDGFLVKEEFVGKSADVIYEIIKIDQVEESENSNANENITQNNSLDSGEEEKSDDGVSTDKKEEKESNDDDGGGTGDPGKAGEVRDNLSSQENEENYDKELNWDEIIVHAASYARGIGNLPGSIDRLIKKKINPRLNWKELLTRFIENSAKSDYTWMTPNKRYIHQNLYLPSLNNSQLNEIVIAIDTSGSILPNELDQFAAEISAILENNPLTIHLIYCDMKVISHESFTRSDLPITIKPKGGGGTDFRPAFKHVFDENIFPSCFIFLTDLECRAFPETPFYPVLWVQTGNSTNQPPFGQVIELQEE